MHYSASCIFRLGSDDALRIRFLLSLQEKKFLLQNKMDELKDKSKQLVENFEGKRHEFIQKWEDRSREFIFNFLELFGREGRLVSTASTPSPPTSRLPRGLGAR